MTNYINTFKRVVGSTLVLGVMAVPAAHGRSRKKSLSPIKPSMALSLPLSIAATSRRLPATRSTGANSIPVQRSLRPGIRRCPVGVIGSSPFAAAVSRGVDTQLFWIQDDINEAEAMIVRNGAGINKPADLKGKKIGVPFASTTHFHTMFFLELSGLKPSEVKLLNLQPNQISAAWERGDIDAAYVWDPALTKLKQSGKVMVTSGELSKKGKATFDGMAVDRKWGEANADFMAKFVKIAAAADADYKANPAAWTVDSSKSRRMSN